MGTPHYSLNPFQQTQEAWAMEPAAEEMDSAQVSMASEASPSHVFIAHVFFSWPMCMAITVKPTT